VRDKLIPAALAFVITMALFVAVVTGVLPAAR
jgi:hypothetical protein